MGSSSTTPPPSLTPEVLVCHNTLVSYSFALAIRHFERNYLSRKVLFKWYETLILHFLFGWSTIFGSSYGCRSVLVVDGNKVEVDLNSPSLQSLHRSQFQYRVNMRVAVIGPTGYSGSHVCVELLNRGHDVIGISRNPDKLGQHKKYTPLKFDVGTATIEELVKSFEGLDVLINGFNPPGGPTMYKTFIETTRKIIIASKAAKVGYFIMIGGTGSLELTSGLGGRYATATDSRE